MKKIMRKIGVNILIDSWGWIEICEGSEKGTKVLGFIKNPANTIFTTSLNIYEVWYQVIKKFNREQAQSTIATINQYAKTILIDQDLAIKAGEIRLQEGLRAVDSFVYAAALATNSHILTGDAKHFGKKKNVILL